MSDEKKKGRSGIQKPGHVQDPSPESAAAPAADRITPAQLAGLAAHRGDPMVIQPTFTPVQAVAPRPGVTDPDPEAAVKCRVQSNLPLFPPFGGGPSIFTDYSAPVSMTPTLGITFYLSDSHLILPTTPIPNCNNDGMFHLPALSENVAAASWPMYIVDPDGRIRQILFIVQPADLNKSLKFGFRIKFEENAAVTGRFNPKRKSGQVAVPKPGGFRIAAAAGQAPAGELATVTP